MDLNDSAREWVETTVEKMTLEECVGQLLCPKNHKDYTADDWAGICRDVPIGCALFTEREDKAQLEQCIESIRQNASLPVVIAADMENGLGGALDGFTIYPRQMAFGATDEPALAEKMGVALAREARSLGIHWTFSPVVDPNINYNNPAINVRAFGDDPDKVIEFAVAKINGLQKDRMLAATAKHFPGDGMDDRDQHLCTTINPLSIGKWRQTYGQIWKQVITSGVQAIMSGHLSLPQYQGFLEHPEDAMPATLSSKLQKELLRDELGFTRLVVSDAASMIGITSRVKPDDAVVENIRSGSDVYLFADARRDFKNLMRAVNTGKIKEERIRESAKRVLALKAWLGLHEGKYKTQLTGTDLREHQRIAEETALKAATLLRTDRNLPAPLKKGAKVLTVDICYGSLPDSDMKVVDDELIKRGYKVDHMKNPDHYQLLAKASLYDRVFVNLQIMPHSVMGTMKLTGKTIMPFWRAFWVRSENAVFTSFGSPYIIYDLPHAPNMLLMYDNSPASQKAAVKAWLGEMEITGTCPVKLPKVSDMLVLD